MDLPRVALAAALLAAAPAARGQPADLETWVVVRTPSISLMTDAGVERGSEIAVSLERFRAVFAQLAPELELSSPAPIKLFAFRDAASFAPYKARREGRGVQILGQFLSHADGNYLTLNADPGHPAARAVIYHEFAHYLVRNNFPRVPLWFNEGLAEYYGTFAIEDGAAVIGRPVERHLAWLRRRGRIDPAAVLGASSASARGHDAEQAGELYAVSWLLVHHLLSGGVERLDQTAAYLGRVAAGEDSEEAFVEAFDLRLSTLAETLLDYARGERFATAAIPLDRLPPVTAESAAMAPAEVLFQLGDLLLHSGRREAAAAHFQLALDHRPEDPAAHAGLAWVRHLDGRLAEAEVLFDDARRLGLRDPLGWLWYGRHLLATLDLEPATAGELAVLAGDGEAGDRGARAARARDAFRRAVELAPDFAEAHAMLGYAHLFGAARPADGIPSLAHAVARLPSRPELVLFLVELHLKVGDVAGAEGWIARGLARRSPELAARAREEVERFTLLEAARKALDDGRIDDALALVDRAVELTSDPQLRRRLAARLAALQQLAGER